MTRLKLIINLFVLVLSVPLAYFVWLSHWGVQQEEKAQLEYVANILFDTMARDLNALVFREEIRAVDEYSYYLAADAVLPEHASRRSPLSYPPAEAYILGYMQTNPDGSLQTPLAQTLDDIPLERQAVIERLLAINAALNDAPFLVAADLSPSAVPEAAPQDSVSAFTNQYVRAADKTDRSLTRSAPAQRITKEQVFNVMQQEPPLDAHEAMAAGFEVEHVQVKVTPMQAYLSNTQDIVMLRHIEINAQVYRQGFVIPGRGISAPSSPHLFCRPAARRFYANAAGSAGRRSGDPGRAIRPHAGRANRRVRTCVPRALCVFTRHPDLRTLAAVAQPPAAAPHGRADRRDCADRPDCHVPERPRGAGTLGTTRPIRVVRDARTQNPADQYPHVQRNVAQGMAPNREREQEYFNVIGAESQRLSRLIEQVLDFARLERKQRRFHAHDGDFDDVVREVRQVLDHTLEQGGFQLKIDKDPALRFRYDREVMAQILLNLIGNSIKFGQHAAVRQITVNVRRDGAFVRIAVADTGPGIPKRALKKVFDDFYRGDHAVSQTTRGTGIGLALVKRYVTALGGSVSACNNPGAGCTIALRLPV
jgi:two-component sensor histidine kinase